MGYPTLHTILFDDGEENTMVLWNGTQLHEALVAVNLYSQEKTLPGHKHRGTETWSIDRNMVHRHLSSKSARPKPISVSAYMFKRESQ